MDKKRPQGRDKYVTGSSTGVHKRGDGLNTGPVGSGSAFQKQDSSGKTTRSNGRSPLLYIIIAAVLALGGGGGALSGLLGGSSGTYDTDSYSNSYNNAYVDSYETATATPRPTATPKPAQSGTAANTAVAAEARDKRTVIRGGGKDTVTVMVYMCGTDLESNYSMATKDLTEMAKASWGDNVHVIVYTGGCTQWRNNIISSSKNQIYEVGAGGLRTLVSDAGSVSMTKPATLTSFIQWCAENYPANRNELILWDHGGGSVSGYGYDEKYKSSGSMTLDGISKALSDAGVTFDFIGFDACLMATLETGLMLDNYADYLIASEETEPGIGWYYTDWLNTLGRNTSISTVDLGKTIVDSFVNACATGAAGQAATLSVVDLAELSATAPAALKDFSQSLSALITENNYQQVSTARSNSREFARSTKIDQVDLVDFAQRVGTDEARTLADALLSAVKYNRTSSGMAGSNGVSIYFPYRKTSNVDKAVSTYSAIGMDESYSQAIREFASLEVCGQASYGGSAASFSSLLESLYGGSTGSSSSSSSSYGGADLIGGLMNAFLGGGFDMISGLDSGNTGFLSGRSLSQEDTVAYLEQNWFDSGALVWTRNAAGQNVIALPDDQWDLVTDIDLNMFYDDGEGYIDLGLDNLYDWDDDGNLIGDTDRTWLAVNGQPVAYYHEGSDDGVIRGYIPAFLNGVRVELVVTFDDAHPRGAIVGARNVYLGGETETVPKSCEELVAGDTLEFVCDYYTYDGEYQNTYYLGEPMTVTDSMVLSNVDVGDGGVLTLYRFTDIYQNTYWTPALEG